MFLKIIPLVLFLFSISQAQTVQKVTGSEAMISIQGSEQLEVGDKVQFLNSGLDVTGQGEVRKISDSGKKALVKITSGKAAPGMTLEKKSDPSEIAPPAEKRRKESLNYYSLSEEDRRILQNGEISNAAYVIGGIVGTYPIGLGLGHAIQGRYSDKGWIFTVGELGSIAVAYAGIGDCFSDWSDRRDSCEGGLITLGLVGFLGFRIWEAIDVWAAPPEINRRYRELKSRTQSSVTWKPLIAPTRDGGMLGLAMTF